MPKQLVPQIEAVIFKRTQTIEIHDPTKWQQIFASTQLRSKTFGHSLLERLLAGDQLQYGAFVFDLATLAVHEMLRFFSTHSFVY